MSQPATSRPRRRLKKRYLIPALLLAAVVLFLAWAVVRGTWADTVARDPATSTEGVVTQLYRTPEGHTQVRAAAVFDHPPRQVWDVLTDYPSHVKMFRYVSRLEATPVGPGRYRLVGVAHSSLWGDWPFQSHVAHHEDPGKGEYRVTWDEPGGEMTVSRGGWALTPIGEGKTRVVYALEVEVEQYPNWLVRNILLDRIGKVVAALGEEVQRRAPAAK